MKLQGIKSLQEKNLRCHPKEPATWPSRPEWGEGMTFQAQRRKWSKTPERKMAALWITEKIGMIRAQGKYWEEGALQWKKHGLGPELKNFAKLCLAAECFWVGVTGEGVKKKGLEKQAYALTPVSMNTIMAQALGNIAQIWRLENSGDRMDMKSWKWFCFFRSRWLRGCECQSSSRIGFGMHSSQALDILLTCQN